MLYYANLFLKALAPLLPHHYLQRKLLAFLVVIVRSHLVLPQMGLRYALRLVFFVVGIGPLRFEGAVVIEHFGQFWSVGYEPIGDFLHLHEGSGIFLCHLLYYNSMGMDNWWKGNDK